MAYVERKVTVNQLFESGKTREPSVRALRIRGEEGILMFVESNRNAYLYDEQLSVIRVRAARACKRPGVRWKDISRELRRSRYNKDRIIELLNQGNTRDGIVQGIVDELSALLL